MYIAHNMFWLSHLKATLLRKWNPILPQRTKRKEETHFKILLYSPVIKKKENINESTWQSIGFK